MDALLVDFRGLTPLFYGHITPYRYPSYVLLGVNKLIFLLVHIETIVYDDKKFFVILMRHK